MNNPNYYLAVGSYENWQSALSKGNIWGLGENRRASWSRPKLGDVIFFYVEVPICAVVGWGTVVEKHHDGKPFFAEDSPTKSEWPWRFRFSIQWPQPFSLLHGKRISVSNLPGGITLHRGFQDLGPVKGLEMVRRCM